MLKRLLSRSAVGDRGQLKRRMTIGPQPAKGKSVDGMTTEEKAAEVASFIKPKHYLWIVPLVSLGVVTTVVVNFRQAKDWVESVAPGYIDHVRRFVGFKEEDIDEDTRVLETLLSNSQPVDVRVSLTPTTPTTTTNSRISSSPTSQIVLRNVSGTTTISELLDLISQDPSLPAMSPRVLASLSFEDSSDPEVVSNFRSQLDAIRLTAASKYREQPPVGQVIASPCALQRGTIITGRDFVPSCWSSSNQGQVVGENPKPAFLAGQGSSFSETELLLYYCNTAARFMASLYAYLAIAGPSFSSSSTRTRSISGHGLGQGQGQSGVFLTLSKGALRTQRAAEAWRPTTAHLAQERRAELEHRLSALRAELKGGLGKPFSVHREIDAIQSDIDATQGELSKLRGWWF